MAIEDEVLRKFDALDQASRNPSGFLRVVHDLYSEDVGGLPTKATSWVRAEIVVYSLRLPSLAAAYGGDLERRTNLSVCLVSAIDMILARKRKRDQSYSIGYSLCRYCWRIGVQSGDRRGYVSTSSKMTHAYCGVHKPQAEIVIAGTDEQKVYRKVINQKSIQKARKVAKLAGRIERWAVQKDARLSRRDKNVRSWVAGLSIAENKSHLWSHFVAIFFPYIANSPKWKEACRSPIEAFSKLEEGNEYEGQKEFHGHMQNDAKTLAAYIMPMMLRLDVSLEVELMIANRKRKTKRTGFPRRSWPDASML